MLVFFSKTEQIMVSTVCRTGYVHRVTSSRLL